MWREIFKSNLAYIAGSFANSLALFLLVPYLVNNLSPEAYGAWSLIEVILLFLTMIILSGLDIGYMREYWATDNEQKRNEAFSTVLFLVTGWGILATIMAGVIIKLFVANNTINQSIYYILLAGFIESIILLFMALFRAQEKAITYVSISFFRLVLFYICVYILVKLGYGLNGAVLGRFIADILIVIVVIVLGHKNVYLIFNRVIAATTIKYGLPLLPANIASYILLASDRFFLEKFAGLSILAIYSFSYKIAAILDILITRPFATDWAPRRFKIAVSRNPQKSYSQILVLYLIAAIAVGLAIYAAAPSIYKLIAPPEYMAGLEILPVLIGAYLLFGLSYPLNVGIMIKDKTKYLPMITWIAAGLCLILNMVTIPRYQMQGAAWSTLISYGVYSALILVFSLKIYPIKYPYITILISSIMGVMGFLGIRIIDSSIIISSSILSILVKFSWIGLVCLSLGFILIKYFKIFDRTKNMSANV